MKNVKRILNLILIILVILSTLLVTKTFAIVTTEMEATGVPSHFHDELTMKEYRSNYDIFCSMAGVIANDPGYHIIRIDDVPEIDLSVDTYPASPTRGFELGTQDIIDSLPDYSVKTEYEEPDHTLRDVKYVLDTNRKDIPATPEEAYILSEMENNIYNHPDYYSRTVMGIEPGQVLDFKEKPWYLIKLNSMPTLYDINNDGTDDTVNLVLASDGNCYIEKIEIETVEVPDFPLFPWLGTHTETVEKVYWAEIEVKIEFTDVDPTNHWSWSSYVQKAWWLVPWVNAQADPNYQYSGGHYAVKSSQLSDEAKAFEEYIVRISNASSVSDLNYTEQAYSIKEVDESGVEHLRTGKVEAPVLNYNPDWTSGVNPEDAEVVYDSETQNYKIGPFSIEYVSEIYDNSGSKVIFSELTGSKVISNLGELNRDEDGILVEKEFAFLHGDRTDGNSGKIDNLSPESGEKFYIVTPYTEKLKEIVDIEFSFKYMNAGAIYDYYIGKGIKETWKVVDYCSECDEKSPSTKYCSECLNTVCRSCYNDCEYCCDGDTSAWCTCNDDVDVYLERTSYTEDVPVQAMAHGLKAARWYEETKINTDKKWTIDKETKGDLKIVKKVEDQDGKPIQVEEDKIYKFKVTIIRPNDDGEYKNSSGGYLNVAEKIVSVKVPAGSSTGSVLVEAETWKGNKTPLYEVEEIEAGTNTIEGYNYATTRLENGKGQYKENNTDSGTYEGVVVTATNIYTNGTEYEKGKLEIVKEIVDEHGTLIKATKERVFEFDVKITDTEGNEVKEIAKIVVEKGSETARWISSEYTWKTGTKASYEIEERPVVGYEDLNGVGTKYTGELINNKIIDPIVVKNKETTLHKGKIQIIKELIDQDGNSYVTPEDEIFAFEVYINGQYDRDVTVTVEKNNASGKSEEIEYEWADGMDEPECKIVEKKHGSFKLVSLEPQKETLQDGLTISFKAINMKTTDTGEHGSLQIIKELKDKDGNTYIAEVDEKFRFEVVVDGKRKDVEIVVPDGESSVIWKSEEYYWEKGETPLSYSVREIDWPSNYEFVSISDEDETKTGNGDKVRGYLKPDAETVEITGVNKLKDDGHEGKIKIVKKLTDSKGNTFIADKDYTFKFDIKVDGAYKETVTLEIKKGESEKSIESSVFYWTGPNAPKYEIIETDSQGFEPTLTNPVGVLKDGKIVEPVEVMAINKNVTEYNTEIKLYKTLVDKNGDLLDRTNTSVLENNQELDFYFRVFVTYSNGKEEVEYVTVTVPANGNYGEAYVLDSSGNYKVYTWKEGETPPTFRVEEKIRVDLAIDNVGETLPEEWIWKEIAVENDNNNLIAGETVVNCYNTDGTTENYHKGELQIAKKLVDSEGKEVEGVEFSFTVEVGGNTETVTIKSGDSWAKEYTWQGDSAPGYTVTEDVPDGYELVSINEKYQETAYAEKSGTEEKKNSGLGNSVSGSLKANNTVLVEVENTFADDGKTGVYTGSIDIQKILEVDDKIAIGDIEDIDKTFKFKVTIYYDDPNKYFTYNGKAYNTLEIYKKIVGDEKAGAITVNYYKEGDGPKYIVEEIDSPSGWQFVLANNETGKITEDNPNPKLAAFINRLTVNRKYILTMELGGQVWNDTEYKKGKPADTGHNGIKEEHEPGIANVKVDIYSTTDGLIMTLYTDSNGRWKVPTIEVPAKNEKYYVTYTYDGQTYEPTIFLEEGIDPSNPTEKERADKFKNSLTDRNLYLDNSMAMEEESAREEFNNKFAEIFGGNAIKDDGTTLGYAKDPSANRIDLEYISRDVEYNGYTKKSSELVTVDEQGRAKYGIEASTKTSKFELCYPFDNQMALVSVDRNIQKHVDISDIDGDGNTTEVIQYTYHAAYPYLNNINLGLVERPHADIAIEKDLDEAIVVVNGKIYKYKYGEIANAQFAEYPDLLYKQIQVNQKNIEYSLNLYKSDYYYRASVYNGVNGNLAYDANSDGDVNTDDNIGKMLDTYLRNSPLNISDGLDSLNLDVYLTYKISVTNESDVYDVEVNEISDYVDSSLELVTEADIIAGKHTKYIDNTDGSPAGAVVVAKKPDWNWTKKPGTITDSTAGWREINSVSYTRYTTTSLNGTKLKSGETVSSKLTFKVNKSSDIFDPGINECIQLGDKYNIVEIDNYSTYYAGTSKVAGRVDEDSAPENINIEKKNSINWYEDDTDRSPVLRLGLYESVRNINGIAWEDQETNNIEYDQIIGDGVLPFTVRASDGKLIPDETPIKNMTTTLVEKVTIDGIDYDFIWPTGGEDPTEDYKGFEVGGKRVWELTGLDSEILTSNETDKEGTYVFAGIPAGDYVVRFTYGDSNTLDMNNDGIIDDLDKDGVGNVKYSGQDYKSTTYQKNSIAIDLDLNGDTAGINIDRNDDGIRDVQEIWDNTGNMGGTEFLNNEWHDLESPYSFILAKARVSDARDDESRRLEVIAKSQNMFYENTSIMDTNNSSYGLDQSYSDPSILPTSSITDDPLETYYMEANTAKLNMNIESVLNSRKGIADGKGLYPDPTDPSKNISFFDSELKYADPTLSGGVKIHVLNVNRKLSNDDSINVKLIKYDVDNIDFGIETRSENNVVLDKQIEQITLKTSAGDILIDAIYDITYNPDATVNISLNSASIGTENLQALNRTSGDLGFRYLNVDKDLLQGATITIKYRITALNTGEVDRCNSALISLGDLVNDYHDPDPTSGVTTTFEELLKELRNQEANPVTGYVYGQYLGKVYYQGADYTDPDNNGVFTKDTIDLDDAVVTSKIKQVIDYVDNDVVFSQMDNINPDTSWTNTTTKELEDNRYIDSTAMNGATVLIDNGGDSNYDDDKILDSNGVAYESDSKNNLIVSVENDSGTTLANPNLMTAITPYDHTTGSNHNSYVNVTVSRYYSSDMDIEEIENIAETLKLYNDVGRRDLQTIQGNTKPALGPVDAAFGENDSSATELITLSPPTGTLISTMLTLQVMAITLAAIAIIAGGIYLIKRKVVIK